MTHEDLIAYGFRQFNVAPSDRHDAFYQFCVREDGAKKLYVNVRFWRHSQYGNGAVDGWDAWGQFNSTTGETFNVDLLCRDMTPAHVVHWFIALHNKLGCKNYEDATA